LRDVLPSAEFFGQALMALSVMASAPNVPVWHNEIATLKKTTSNKTIKFFFMANLLSFLTPTCLPLN
jgi:hypothetical protein